VPHVTSPTATSIASPRFCRACGYDLRASANRCPDCGRPFDALDPRTYRRHRPREAWKWARRASSLVLALAALLGGSLLYLRQGLRREQASLAELRPPRADALATYEPLSPWLRRRLPERAGVFLERITKMEVWFDLGGDAELQIVGRLTHLRQLFIAGADVTDAGIARLAGLKELERLEFACPRITDASVEQIARLRRLRELSIQGGDITDAALDRLDALPNLRDLTICMNHVSREALLRWLRRHPGVTVIDGPEGPLKP
jgi:hypothetical protein